MEFLLKQRLVGAAVIIALAVIIPPMIFQGKGQQGIREIPKMPEVRGPVNKGIIREQPVPQAADTPTVVTGKESSGKPEKPAADKPGTAPADRPPAADEPGAKPGQPKAPATTPIAPASKPANKDSKPALANPSWAIQVGSFSTRRRALAVRNRLRKLKYHAYVDKLAMSSGKPLYRVRIGPFASKTEAGRLLKKLRKNRAYAKSFLATHP